MPTCMPIAYMDRRVFPTVGCLPPPTDVWPQPVVPLHQPQPGHPGGAAGALVLLPPVSFYRLLLLLPLPTPLLLLLRHRALRTDMRFRCRTKQLAF